MNIQDETNERIVYDEFQKIHGRLIEKEMVLTHRDFHSRNIMVKNDELIIIDFQDARWGIPQYDLVSLLEDCYYELDSTVKENLKKYYYNALESVVKDQGSFEEFCSLYDDMAIQRVFKAIGSFAYIYNKRSDVRYLKYIGFAMEKLKRIMLKSPKYDILRKSIFKFYYDS
jgi:aminoglycoside/choline kinase family phosphotransferase